MWEMKCERPSFICIISQAMHSDLTINSNSPAWFYRLFANALWKLKKRNVKLKCVNLPRAVNKLTKIKIIKIKKVNNSLRFI